MNLDTKTKSDKVTEKQLKIKKVIKILSLSFAALTCIVLLVTFLFAGGSPGYSQDKQAISYLKDRYGEDFKVIRSANSDTIGSSKTFRKVMAPTAMPSLEFHLEKCLSRCRNYENKDYEDSYPSVVYEQELKSYIQQQRHTFGVSDNDNLNISVWRSKYNSTDTHIFKDGTKELESIMDVPLVGKSKLGFSVYINKTQKNPTEADFLKYAEIIEKIRNHFADKNMVTNFVYTVDIQEEAPDSNAESYRFYVYRYRTDPYSINEQQDSSSISKQFKKEILYKKRSE